MKYEAPDLGEVEDCRTCRFAIFAEEGYSNYTVEGTNFYCAKGTHPEDGFDAWYKESLPNYVFGLTCSDREKGEPVGICVENCGGWPGCCDLNGGQKRVLEMWGNLNLQHRPT